MIDPIFRVRQGLILLAAVFLLSVVSFRVFADYSWLEAVWLVVVTFSTVGYGERPNQPATVQLLTLLVIVGGVSALGFTSAMLVQSVLDRDFAKALGVRKLNKRLAELKGHVVICGCGRLGSDLASQLSHRNIPCVALDCAESFREIPMDDTVIVIHGDATSEELLMRAGIERARTIVLRTAQ